MLVRLANETGGRLTRATNDFSLGFARAQRDLGCRYTLGVYLSNEVQDTPRRMSVRVHKPGLDVRHPDKYIFRSASVKRTSDLTAAFLAPEMFQTGYVRAHVLTLHPRTAKLWDTLVAISFPVDFDEPSETVEIDFGAVVRQGSEVVHTFNRRVTLRSKAGFETGERRFMFLEPADLAPGSYELTVVTAETDGESRPGANRVRLEVPPIPKGELMLVRPILGQPRDKNIVVRGGGDSTERQGLSSAELAALDLVAPRDSFEPMLVQIVEDADQVLSRNKACLVGRKKVPATTVERSVSSEGQKRYDLPSVPLELEPEGKVLCQNVYEVLPPESIVGGGYLFEASIDETPKTAEVRESLRFAVDREQDEPDRGQPRP